MRIYLIAVMLAGIVSSASGQQPVGPTPPQTEQTPASVAPKGESEAPCRADDALCILTQSLRKKDPGIGSKSGTIDPGFFANQPHIPGGKLDTEFLQKNEVKG